MVAVRYRCPRCDTVVTVDRSATLADLAVTPYPFEGWDYVVPTESAAEGDGYRFVCGESRGVEWDGAGCGDPFYLSFVRFEGGQRVTPDRVPEPVHLATDGPPRPPGPPGPGRR